MDIVDVAISQIGNRESNGTHMKYINWYGGFGSGTPWCAIFVSWCANQAGISTNNIPKYASCAMGKQWFVNRGKFKYKGQYTPKRGDIVFFLNNRSHTGIVESVSGGTLHTVEGNTSNMVARRSYSLGDSHITGYGLSDSIGSTANSDASNGTNSSEAAPKKEIDVSEELSYLKKMLAKSTPVETNVTGQIEQTKKHAIVNIQLFVDNGKDKFLVPVLDGMQLTLERFGVPGKLTFSTPFSKKYQIEEGNIIWLSVDKTELFYGFVFTKQTDANRIIHITAYDQLRYLKNKDIRIYTNKTTNQLVQMIAQDFSMHVGVLENTKYAISRTEIDISLFDMIQNSLDETLLNTGELYILYDDFGKLTLRNIKNLKRNTVISANTIQDYSYETTIDSDVYNQIKLVYEGEDKINQVFLKKNNEAIQKWGILQYYEKIDSPKLADLKSEAILKTYGSKQRKLEIMNAIGDTKIKAGTMLPIFLNLGDIKISNYMMAERVTHNFSNRIHTMDLLVRGGGFLGSQ